jgi:uracil-DNA glycosylase family protein
LPALRDAAAACQGCPLYIEATQVVFGEGPAKARIMMVGEQPGNEEDLEGHPFVGPAGRLLDELMKKAGIDRRDVYVTNAVKHFKFDRRGKLRMHATPLQLEINACRPWLQSEVEAVKPRVLVLLGATAAKSVLGASFRITQSRGVPVASTWCEQTLATFHPSAALRAPTPENREEKRRLMVEDLRLALQLAAPAKSE